jgi:hypothetical protein
MNRRAQSRGVADAPAARRQSRQLAVEPAFEFRSFSQEVHAEFLERVRKIVVRAFTRQADATLRNRPQFIDDAFDHKSVSPEVRPPEWAVV